MMPERLRRFFFPKLNRVFWIRLAVVAAASYAFFGHVCIPTRIHGASMEPTYRDATWNSCWRPRYWFSKPKVGDVVIVRYAGTRVMLLKRIVALAGDTVEFRHGTLFVNGEERPEDYVQGPCDWNLAPREVTPGCVYVVGDNRSMSMARHKFGKTPAKRIVGGPLW